MKKEKYIIVDFSAREFFKDKNGQVKCYDTLEEACEVCDMYELDNVWVVKTIYNHLEAINLKTENHDRN